MTVGQCVCMCVLGVLVLGFISFWNREKKKLSVFEKLHVNIVGEKLTFVVRWVFICHSKWWRKQWYSWITVVMLTILKLIIPALLEQGLLMSAVFLLEVSCGQGKRNKGKEWYPTHPGSAVATLPHTLYPPPTPPGNCAICGANRSLCFSCHKALVAFVLQTPKPAAPCFSSELHASPWSHSVLVCLASHLTLSAHMLGDLL